MAGSDTGDETTLLLVRHGESRAMADGIVGGPTGCTGLTDLGRRQAEALRDRFAAGFEPAVDVVFSSPLPRAYETTAVVAPALRCGSTAGNGILVHDDLEEMRLGVADGLTWTAARRRLEWVDPVVDPYSPVVEGAESRDGFRRRIAAALVDLADRHPGATVFVGCHGGTVTAAMAAVFGVGPEFAGLEGTVSLTSITRIDVGRRGGTVRWTCRRFNDAAHLAGTGPARPGLGQAPPHRHP